MLDKLAKFFAKEPDFNPVVKPPETLEALFVKKLDNLAPERRLWFESSFNSYVISSMTIGTTLIANLLFRRSLLLYEGAHFSYLICPAVTTVVNATIQQFVLQPKILLGGFDCQLCCGIRGSVNQAALGFAAPMFICWGSTCAIAKRYDVVKLPSLMSPRQVYDFWRPRLLSITRKVRPLLLMHVLVGGAMALKQWEVAEEVAESITDQEYRDTVNRILSRNIPY